MLLPELDLAGTVGADVFVDRNGVRSDRYLDQTDALTVVLVARRNHSVDGDRGGTTTYVGVMKALAMAGGGGISWSRQLIVTAVGRFGLKKDSRGRARQAPCCRAS